MILNRLIQIMSSLGLQFTQHKSLEGNYEYRLEPPLDVFLRFTDLPNLSTLVGSHGVRTWISQEIDKDRIRKMECSKKKLSQESQNHKSSSSLKKSFTDSIRTPINFSSQKDKESSLSSASKMKSFSKSRDMSFLTLESQLRAAQQNSRVDVQRVAKDFFGRPILVVNSDDENEDENDKMEGKEKFITLEGDGKGKSGGFLRGWRQDR